MSSLKIVELDETNTCKLCDNALARYSCPRCNIIYCSLPCYRSTKHRDCAEEFYKNCIVEELASSGNNSESRRRMIKILQRHHGYVDEEDDGRVSEGGDSQDRDSDDGEDVEDIAQRLAGVDLDDADRVWEKLTKDEQQEFIAFLKSDQVTKMIPSWTPWWAHASKSVEEVEKAEKFKEECPPIGEIKNFKALSKKEPDDCVKFNLINVLAAYAFTARYFNGEAGDFCKEAVSCVITLSLCLKDNQNFEDFETAVKSVEHECGKSDWIVADLENYNWLRDDMDKILKGPSASDPKFYVLAALSHFHQLLGAARKGNDGKSAFSRTFPSDHFPSVKAESKTKIKACIRKVEYLMSYAKDCFAL